MKMTTWLRTISVFACATVLCLALVPRLAVFAAAPELARVGGDVNGMPGSGDGEFNEPYGIAKAPDGKMAVVDASNNRIQIFDSNGQWLASFGTHGTGDGQFDFPSGVTFDSQGNIIVTEVYNNRVQKFNSSYVWQWTVGGTGSGTGDYEFYQPFGVAVDNSDNIYIADTYNHRIQKFDNDGNFLASFGSFGTAAGQFKLPFGITLDAAGNIYTAEYDNNRIQKLNSSGVSQWILGGPAGGSGDGEFFAPAGITLDPDGDLIVTDFGNARLVMLDTSGVWHWSTTNNYTDFDMRNPIGTVVQADGTYFVVDKGWNSFFTTAEPSSITNLPAGLRAVLTSDWSTDVTATTRVGTHSVGILKGNNRIAALPKVNLNNNRDWSGLMADTDGVRSALHVVYGIYDLPGESSTDTYTLYVPKLDSDKVWICPGIATLAEITPTCLNGTLLGAGDPDVTIASEGGINYWKISGLQDTGGIGIRTSGIRDTLSRQKAGVASDHTISFQTANGIQSPGDSIVLAFDPAAHGFDLSTLAITDIEFTDVYLVPFTLAAVPGADTWGVVIDSTQDTITFTAPTSGAGYIDNDAMLIFKIGKNAAGGVGQIVNPPVGSVAVKITATNSFITEPETASILVPIVDSDEVDVTGFINTYINFDIDTNTDGSECAYNTCPVYEGGPAGANYTVDLGELNSAWVNKSEDAAFQHSDGITARINSIYFDLTTNAISGAVLTVTSLHNGLLGPSANLIPSVTTGMAIDPNSGLYGFMLPEVQTGDGVIGLNHNCINGLTYCSLTDTGTEVFDTSGHPLAQGRTRMDLAAAASYTNNPGLYTDTLTFIAVATY